MGVAVDSHLSESILIQGGYYCGRRFTRDGIQAVWFAEEGQLKFYCREGTVVEVCTLPSATAKMRDEAA